MTQLLTLGGQLKRKAAAVWKAQKHRVATVLAIGQVTKTVVSPLAPAMLPPSQPLAPQVSGPAILRSVGDDSPRTPVNASTEQFAQVQKKIHKERRTHAMDAAQADRSQVSEQHPPIPRSKAPQPAKQRSRQQDP